MPSSAAAILLLLFLLSYQILVKSSLGGLDHPQQQHYSRSAHFHRIEASSHQQGQAAAGAGVAAMLLTSGKAQRLNRCYSCMSPLYEQLFKDSDLGSFFYEPRNFTPQCETEPMDGRGVGLVPCRGICLSLAQEFIIMGRKTGKRLWMRGCAHSLSRHGYQNRTIAYFAEFDMCREVHASELFRLAEHSSELQHFGGGGGGGGFMSAGPMDGQTILVCSCLGDRCNTQSSSAVHHRLWCPPILFLLLFILLPLFPTHFSFQLLYHSPFSPIFDD